MTIDTLNHLITNLSLMTNVLRSNYEAKRYINASIALSTIADIVNDIRDSMLAESITRVENINKKYFSNLPEMEIELSAKAVAASQNKDSPIWWARRHSDARLVVASDRHTCHTRQMLDFGWIKIRAKTREDAQHIAEAVL